MKKINNLKSILAFSITAISIFILSCDFKGVTDDFDIQITNDILKQEALISVIDVVNPTLIEGSDKLKVEVLGPDADKFVTNSGEKISNLKVIDGNIELAVNPKFTSSEPLKALLKISGNNYLTTTIPLVMFPEDTLVTKSINIVNKLNTVEGVDFIENTKALVNNTIPTDHIIKTTNSKSATKTTVEIESGTVFQDANGNTITGISLKSEVAHFSVETPEAIASFPGGLTPINVIDENGEETDDISFITAGFASIDMFIGNKEVKKFSKPISISIEIPSDYINPDTEKIIAVGDQIPIWSYDENGQWSYHKTGTVSINSDGKYNMTFETNHLSWWNIDWRRRRAPRVFSVLQINSPNVSNLSDNYYRLEYDIVYASNNQAFQNGSILISKTNTNSIRHSNLPASNLKILVYFRNLNGERIFVYGSPIFNGSTNAIINFDSQTISRLINAQPQIKNVYIQFQAKCGDKVLNPFLRLYRLETYTYNWRGINYTYNYWRVVGYAFRGRGYIGSAKMGVPQKYRVYFGGRAYDYDYTFNSDRIVIGDFQAPGDLCNRLF